MTGNADPAAAKSYYRHVDAGNLEEVFALFADDIRYTRSGPRVIDGIEEFREFYENDRALSGEHSIGDMVVSGDHVAVQGTFAGKSLLDDSDVSFGFADFLRFDDQGLIVERATYNNMLSEPL
ncbi:MAG: nuclear transport factor 2 family protein [Halovenus sp.]